MPDRERHCGDADDAGRRGSSRPGPGWATPAATPSRAGTPIGQPESEPSQATAVAATGRCRPAGDRADRAETSGVDRRHDGREQRRRRC